MHLRPVEGIAIGYFAYLAVIAWLVPLSRPRRALVTIQSIAAACLVIVVAVSDRVIASSLVTLRDWAPAAYILVSYKLPAQLVSSTDPAAERALSAFDRQWAVSLSDALARASPWLIELLELAYLFCYPMLPAGFAVIYWLGEPAAVDRFWTAVFVAATLSYGLLPWVRTRPPRQLYGAPPRRSSVRLLNEAVLHRASVQLNTFPSGHVSTAVATALAVTADVPAAGVWFLLLALAIAVACIAGRYHYLADVLTGAAAGVLAFALSRLI
jgi:membrane-associated phospholipid phosphatase